jgi:replicative DNA helicase
MAPVIIDNLHKFGPEFQLKLIAALIKDKAFFERVIDIIDLPSFETDSHRWIVKECMQYLLEYKNTPTPEVFRVRLETIENPDLKADVKEQIKAIGKQQNAPDLQFCKEQFLEFCKNRKLRAAIYDSVEHLQRGEYDKVKVLVDTAMKAGMERDIGHNYHTDIAIRMSEMCRKVTPTGWNAVDDLLDGGLGPGELGVIVGSAGGGKSWCLARLGANAMLAGKNVAHFTLELNQNYVGLRYDCCFTGISFQEIKHKQSVVEEKLKHVKGKLFVKFFPLKTVSAQSLKFHVERIQMLHNIKIDVMIVDYADILKPQEKERNSNSYSEAGGIYEELRQVAGELQIPIWSASQGNRGSAQEEIIQSHDIADSYRKIMTADFALSLSRNIEDKANGTARFHVMKNRFGADGLTFYSKMDASNGQIELYDSKSKESVEIKSTMRDTDNSLKSMIKNKWNNARQTKCGEDINT